MFFELIVGLKGACAFVTGANGFNVHSYPFFFGILAPDFVAVERAAAIDCFFECPLFSISEIFSPIIFLLFPCFNGMMFPI